MALVGWNGPGKDLAIGVGEPDGGPMEGIDAGCDGTIAGSGWRGWFGLLQHPVDGFDDLLDSFGYEG